MHFSPKSSSKTVVVMGGSYGGKCCRAARVLAEGLPQGWRVVLIDRNSHINHIYNLPRYAVLPGHEHKAFIPYDNIFRSTSEPDAPLNSNRHLRLHATITSLNPRSIGLSRSFPELGITEPSLSFDYAVYALGSHLPTPIDLWGAKLDVDNPKASEAPDPPAYTGTKKEGASWLQQRQKRVENASSVLVVGGGALGIQFASDIADVYPNKHVTLLHSRNRLLPRFDPSIHDEILQSLVELNVEVITGERLDLQSVHETSGQKTATGSRMVRTMSGREIAADLLLLCTGQIPNTALLEKMDSRTIVPEKGMARVLQTMQLSVPPSPPTSGSETMYPHIFVVGDAADAFDALNAGHTAYYQAEVAARNILRLIRRQEHSAVDREGQNEGEELELYTPGPPAIKVSLGLTRSVYEVNGIVGVREDGNEDLNAKAMWASYGMRDVGEEGMHV
ncbi:FAD/NAD(P)-binding domain-containing protein [Leucogyrophana mollusca]|uniref:FAD/NAD(P)-binding domain-containing protein n=1 Tax=Leucogyrophana mollusca TaxID=85980 RepID=A0ACB8BJD2_9AGAM|nr:FAD/NAD(P)-binding domain-containing protein [Leucogyrophana mollusca]